MLDKGIIDAHGHILESMDFWKDYLEPKYRDRAIRLEKTAEGIECLVFNNKRSPYSVGVGPFTGGIGRAYEELSIPGKFSYFDGPTPAFDAQARLNWLDTEGIAATLLYPSVGLLWGAEVKEREVNEAYCRAYNTWMVDFCKANPKRMFPVAQISLIDIEAGIAEINRAAKLGAKGALIFATPQNNIGFWDRVYDPLWATLQELDLPAIFHPALNESFHGSQWIKADEGGGIVDDRYLLYMETSAVVIDVQAAFATLFQGGVFDRFPRLKVVLLETGTGWIAHALERFDSKYRRVGSRSPLKNLPSEYFRRQCWIAFEPDETTVPLLVQMYGADRFIWGSDMPHWDASPTGLQQSKAAIASLSQEQQELILGGNAIRAFNLK